MKVGVNCHPNPDVWPLSELVELEKGVKELACFGVRFPLWLGTEDHCLRFADLCLNDGIEVLPVLDRRSFTEDQVATGDFAAGMAHWKALLPKLTQWQIGNEADQDHPDAGASWFLPKTTYSKLFSSALTLWDSSQLTAGGLVKVDFSYLPLVPSGIRHAVHPYDKTGATIGPLLTACVNAGHKMPICTEFGSPETDELKRGPWFSEMLVAMWQKGVEVVYAYCYSKRQDAAMGLVTGSGVVTNSYAAVKHAIPVVAGAL